jgi:excinuclease ABC subunit A
VLDEPSVGLHAADVHKLIHVIDQLVDDGNTVVVIEHHLDIIKVADWIVDLGPEGGAKGGQVITQGPPETIAAHKTSHTGRFLRPVLEMGEALRNANGAVAGKTAKGAKKTRK